MRDCSGWCIALRLVSHLMSPLRKRKWNALAPCCRAKELPFIASMGIYVAKASAIKELLTQHFPSQHDFGSDIIPGAKDLGFHVQARPKALILIHNQKLSLSEFPMTWTYGRCSRLCQGSCSFDSSP